MTSYQKPHRKTGCGPLRLSVMKSNADIIEHELRTKGHSPWLEKLRQRDTALKKNSVRQPRFRLFGRARKD